MKRTQWALRDDVKELGGRLSSVITKRGDTPRGGQEPLHAPPQPCAFPKSAFVMAELASPRGEREQKVTADMLDKARASPDSGSIASRVRLLGTLAWRAGGGVTCGVHTPAT